jgi:exonuclease III
MLPGINLSTHQNGPASQFPTQDSRQFGGLSLEVLDMLRAAITESGRASGQDIVALIGNTGTGKSTAVNDFTGHPVIYDESAKVMRVAQGNGIAKIGHRASTSETLYTHVHVQNPILGTSLVLADSGGFLDTRGAEEEIAIATSLKLTLENARTVRLVLCFDATNIESDRYVHFAQFIQTSLGRLMGDYRRGDRSTMVMFTKAPLFEDSRARSRVPYTHDSAIRQLERARQDLEEGTELRELYDYVLRDNGRYVSIYDPTIEETKDRVLTTLCEMEGIPNPGGFFRLAYSSRVKLKLTELMVEISLHGTRLYSGYFYNASEIEKSIQEKGRIADRVTKIREALENIGGGAGDPELIQRNLDVIIQQQEAIIADQRENIRRCTREEEEIQAVKESIQERLDLLRRDGDQEEAYWKDGIHQKGINIDTVITNTVTTYDETFMGILGQEKETRTTTSTTRDKRPITRDFYYKGPEISRIELLPQIDAKTPEGEPYWLSASPENPAGSDSFSIHYQTAKGEDAEAEINVFVLKKHLPVTMLQTDQHNQEIRSQMDKLYRLGEQKREYERIISEAERAKDAQGSLIDRVDQYKTSLEELESEIQRIDSEISSLESKNRAIEEGIQGDEENFMFLKNYLELSHDNELADAEAVRQFLELDEQFRGLSDTSV